MSAAVRLHDVTLGYERHPAVHHLDGAFEAGRLTAVVGPNGSGKSTLLRGMAGALQPLAGRIDLEGIDPREVAYLPQDAGIDRAFPMTLGELVALGFWRKRGLFGGLSREDRRRLHDAFDAVGLGGFENRPLNAVSGGQFQRALFARVLIQDARLILLDEPFSAVDQKTTADLLSLLERWPREGRTVVMVLHDLEMARETCADALLLAREMVAWGPARETLAPENLLKARRLSEGFDEHAHVCKREA